MPRQSTAGTIRNIALFVNLFGSPCSFEHTRHLYDVAPTIGNQRIKNLIDPNPLLKSMTLAALKVETILRAAFEAPIASDIVQGKPDGTLVTETDKAAERAIRDVLYGDFPDIPVIGEETADVERIPASAEQCFFLIDPLDGTSEFTRRSRDFTANIAFVENGRATIGIVLVPMHGELFTGSPLGAFKTTRLHSGEYAEPRPIGVRGRPAKPVVITSATRRPPKLVEYLESLEMPYHERQIGSLLKICRIAEGEADLYPCPMDTNAWDTAASQVVLEAAGGRVLEWTQDNQSRPLSYEVDRFRRTGNFLNPHFRAEGGLGAHTHV